MSALNARSYVQSIELGFNQANRRAAGQHAAGSRVKKHEKAQTFRFPKNAQRFDPNAGPVRTDVQVA